MLLNEIMSFYIFLRGGTSSQILIALTKTFIIFNLVDTVRQFNSFEFL